VAALDGKTVVITGGARRIGRAIALACARAGADVAITFLESKREAERTCSEIQALDRQALALRCDVRDPKSVQALARAVLRDLKSIDVLVNNAGTFETAKFDEISPEQWTRVFETNTRGPYLVAQAFLDALRSSEGRIVNLGSLGGLRPWVTHAHYCASKAALTMLTQVMAKALAPAIAVNCVAPGMIDSGEKKSAATLTLAEKTPMRRNGTAEEVAAAVLFFATAPKFITGQVLVVDGGLGL
jgi:NAD(P)-dependent dehydrogenase (short-subunit alcohol dehydrogenase family)